MNERFFTLGLFVCGAVYLYFGLKIEVPFSYEPLGPRTFPVLLGSSLLALCLLTLFVYKTSTVQFRGVVVRQALAVVFYLLTFKLLGFMLATTITAYAMARLVGSSWMEGLLTGLVIAIFFYGVFHLMLGVPLPLGSLFRPGS